MNWAAAIIFALVAHVIIGAVMSLVDWTDANKPEQSKPKAIETLAIIHFAETEADTPEEPATTERINEPTPPERDSIPAPVPMIEAQHETLQPEPVPEPVPPVTINPTQARPKPFIPVRPVRQAQTITRTAPLTTASARTASTPINPRDPLSKKAVRAQKKYLGELMAWLAKHKEYEASLKKEGIEGIVKVRFTISKTGEIVSAEIAESSGSSKLDAAALSVLKNANPVPAIPSLMERDQLTLTLPIDFSLITE